MKKIVYALAFGIGYVLGARAGRERYEQLRDAAERFQSDPRVQDAVHKAEAFAEDAVHAVRDEDKRHEVVDSLKGTVGTVRAQATGAAEAVKETVEDATDGDLSSTVESVKDTAKDLKDEAVSKAEDVKDAADEGGLSEAVDTAKDAAKDVKDEAAEQAGEVREKVAEAAPRSSDEDAIADAVGSAQQGAKHVRDESAEAVERVAQKAQGAADETGTPAALEDPDAHIPEVEDEIVHTSGPDDQR
ncbi:hypothetical protein [Aeromicrobium sp. REDSEA-S38_B2]|uniref:hypothetical protein n=1 Tax=Aeromicrobium sp. REDSEA-S38_B2 TaxID=1811528 RepID=UPI000AF33EBB|nr:hypothetical protein [Aeromicrobium sp. REDSEA-S38_B2]